MMKKKLLMVLMCCVVLVCGGCGITQEGVETAIDNVDTMMHDDDPNYAEYKGVYHNFCYAVEQEIDSPATAEFQDFSTSLVTKNGEGNYTVKAYVDAENGFGAMVRSTFTMSIQYTEDGSQFSYQILSWE